MSRVAQIWALTLLTYLVLLGSVPMVDRLFSPGVPEGFHPRHNAHVSWQLFHIPVALAGIVLGLWLIRARIYAAGLWTGALAIQATLAWAEYRRIGYNAAGSRDITVAEFAAVATIMAMPFILVAAVLAFRGRQRRVLSFH